MACRHEQWRFRSELQVLPGQGWHGSLLPVAFLGGYNCYMSCRDTRINDENGVDARTWAAS